MAGPHRRAARRNAGASGRAPEIRRRASARWPARCGPCGPERRIDPRRPPNRLGQEPLLSASRLAQRPAARRRAVAAQGADGQSGAGADAAEGWGDLHQQRPLAQREGTALPRAREGCVQPRVCRAGTLQPRACPTAGDRAARSPSPELPRRRRGASCRSLGRRLPERPLRRQSARPQRRRSPCAARSSASTRWHGWPASPTRALVRSSAVRSPSPRRRVGARGRCGCSNGRSRRGRACGRPTPAATSATPTSGRFATIAEAVAEQLRAGSCAPAGARRQLRAGSCAPAVRAGRYAPPARVTRGRRGR